LNKPSTRVLNIFFGSATQTGADKPLSAQKSPPPTPPWPHPRTRETKAMSDTVKQTNVEKGGWALKRHLTWLMLQLDQSPNRDGRKLLYSKRAVNIVMVININKGRIIRETV